MADNTGNYLSYADLIGELFLAGSDKVTSEDTTLSSKTVDAGGDIYDYTGGTPLVGQVVSQNGFFDEIIAVLTGPDRVRISKTGAENPIVDGAAKFLSSESIPKGKGEDLILDAMDLIDEHTRNFFNKRTGVFQFEGNNTPLLLLPVPIIEIDELKINSTETVLVEGEDNDYVAFKNRARPQDDRRNPRIKLNIGRGRDSIFTGPAFTNRIFMKNSLTTITGSFGWLEPDGSTPRLIQKAVKLLAFKDINDDAATSTSSTAPGAVRRIKVDLHEKEFFERRENKTSSSSTTGIKEVDEIIAKFRSPIFIDGSIPFIPSTQGPKVRSTRFIQ